MSYSLTVHLLLMEISSPNFLLYSKLQQENLYRIKDRLLFCSHLLERLPRLLWDLFSPEGEDKTHTGGFNKCRAEGRSALFSLVCVLTTVR